MAVKPARAKALSVEDRQAMLIDAVTPLLLEHGQAVTTRQIADCAGIAEGTIFRAFGSKDELIQAAVARHLDPEPFRRQLRAIDPLLPLEDRIRAIVAVMRARFTTLFTLMSALGRHGPPPGHEKGHHVAGEFAGILAGILADDLERFRVPAERVGQIVRMVTLAASVPQIRDGPDFDDAEITALILHGIMGAPVQHHSIATPHHAP
ncbi:TetR/AcrR family transcriptional regulator [Cryobacterium mannosilyticum]|uniref:TetR/AcrR family transcriptional regulator n=1 Tax=Cryobacterium mannosilyticum TaxID=1259190 RepID=A0A4R8W3V5_9MICO|nr:TetR/AcrR family transcriptional regulator [Cryobacterium mannosilyticum]TFB99929.1 TetR/AcrR family transcriptional regulator [Cryobacterium mannosilyticum]